MNSNPVVGIVTRTKNRGVLLRRAIESVLQQTYPYFAMIIVNDGGDPEAVDRLCATYSERADGRIRVVHNPQSLGMEGASKIGIEAIQSDLIILHDDDDSWAPEFLSISVEQLVRMQRTFPSVEGVTTYSHRVLERVQGHLVHIDSVESFNGWVPHGFLSLDRMLVSNFIPPISFLFSRRAFDALGGLYEAIPYLGDWDFLVRFLSRYDVYMIPQYLAFYHWRVDGVSEAMGNTVTTEVDTHRLYRQYLLNQWLREDLASGRLGIGVYANLRGHLETLLDGSNDLPGGQDSAGPDGDLVKAHGRDSAIKLKERLPAFMEQQPCEMGGEGNMETLNGATWGSDVVEIKDRTAIRIRGWAIDGIRRLAPAATFIRLQDDDNRQFYAEATLEERPDVALALGEISLSKSGYRAYISAESLPPGEYQATIAMDVDGRSVLHAPARRLRF